MGLMLRVRLSSFFAGAASASVAGFYFLYEDYKLAQDAISHQADCAAVALSCNGRVLGSLPIRVSPSKAPVH